VLDGADVARCGATGLRAVFEAGVDQVQLRDRALGGAALLEAADALCACARGVTRAVRVVVNRRADVALAAGAHGLHLGFDALSPARARGLLGAGAWIGLSAHAPDEIAGATTLSYAHLAPIFDPLSKPASRPALGLGALTAARTRGVPVLAQGGIDPANVAAAIAAGAAGVAVTGFLSGADDPARAAAALRSALDA
jgi:thiamine-phosphate pyrophosphorylase